MTETIVRCDNCESLVELTRMQNKTLTLSCDCGESRSIKVKQAIPEGWTA